jgi:hypothetical protein
MVGTCSNAWRGDEETRRRCEETIDPSDPLSSNIPVTDKATATTYRNLHCALCNLATDAAPDARDQWEMWGARLECPTVLTGSRDLASVRHALRFENGTWGLRLPRNISGSVPQPPQRVDNKSSKLIYDQIEPFISKNETRSRSPRNRPVSRRSRLSRVTTTTTSTTTEAPIVMSSGLRHLSRRQYALYNASQFHRNDSSLARLLNLRRREHTKPRERRDTTEQLTFHKCDLDPLLPDTLTHLVRRCRPRVIGSCPDTWIDTKVRSSLNLT